MPETIILGEALVDFVPTESGLPLAEVPGFYKRFGGAPANVAMGMSKLGSDVGFVGKVGQDSFGDFLKDRFVEAGVNVDQLYRTGRANTTLAFVSLTEVGDRDFAFYRNPGADELLKPEEIREQAFKDARVFHFGSLSLTKKESKEATEKAIEVARKNGLKVTMDPNIRFNLWSSHSVLKKLVRSLLKKVDILKLSKEEVSFLTGSDDLGVGTAELADLGPDPVIVTLGEEGCLFYYKGTLEKLDSYKVEVKDTTGAGDGFMAGFLHTLLKNTENLSELDSRELLPAVRFGNATGALTTTDYGATSAFPNSELVESFLA
ncbi:carbohydrate kinase, partial [Candidatus Bipolaricaulota bacterium]|nr:carbohydrate kinase [Candidatus Bipolaricaulota bacterium]